MKIPRFLYIIYEQNPNQRFCFSPGKGLKIYIDRAKYVTDPDYELEGDDSGSMQSRVLLYDDTIRSYSYVYEPEFDEKEFAQRFSSVDYNVSVLHIILYRFGDDISFQMSCFDDTRYLAYCDCEDMWYYVDQCIIKRLFFPELIKKGFLHIQDIDHDSGNAVVNDENSKFYVYVQSVIDKLGAVILIQTLWRGLAARRMYHRLKIGVEIKCLPNIGIDFQNVQNRNVGKIGMKN